jgi:hypothetical protein
MSVWDKKLAQEAHDEAAAMMEVELPEGCALAALEGAAEGFDAGVWYGIAATLSVLGRHGIVKFRKDPDDPDARPSTG